MGQQYGGAEDGHVMDAVIYLLSGYTVCTLCGCQLAGLSWNVCRADPYWRDGEYGWGPEGFRLAEQHERFNEVNDRVQKEKVDVGLSGLWQNPSL